MPDKPIIFIIDIDTDQAESLATPWRETDYDVEIADGASEIMDRLISDENITALVTSQQLSGEMNGLALIETLHKRRPMLPLVMVSGTHDSGIAIQAIQAGAYDFLPKPTAPTELLEVLSEAIEGARNMSRKISLTPSEETGSNDYLIGRSRAMAHVYRNIARLSATPVTVLIRGETGTGKELIARAIYQHGHRAHQPFIAVNCAAIPPNLLESELFGHEKGAFTGAISTRIGRFEQAHGATLFLDEIGDMDHSLQAKLLRVLQEKTIQRVGGRSDIPVDVRFIAATHQNLEKMIEEGQFREDLFYRLNTASINLPPLRDRSGDVRLLTEHFLLRYGKDLGIAEPAISPEAMSFLERQLWPGNIRQLQNVLRRTLIQRQDFAIRTEDIQALLEKETSPSSSTDLDSLCQELLTEAEEGINDGAYRAMLTRMESALISQALTRSGGNLAKAARWLGITRYTLREKTKQLDL